MTMTYYCDRLLPIYINQIHKARMNDDWNHPGRAILQEDGDPSHGTVGNSDNKAKSLRKANWIETYLHPAKSPDLNPIEGIWLRLKTAVRRRWKDYWGRPEVLKRIIIEEWDRISLSTIRELIADMPSRCKKLVETGGMPIKKDGLW